MNIYIHIHYYQIGVPQEISSAFRWPELRPAANKLEQISGNLASLISNKGQPWLGSWRPLF